MSNFDRPKRVLRSFVRRAGRMTPAQLKGLESGWPRYGMSVDQGRFDASSVFGRETRRVLEIGFGMGDAFIEQVKANPETDFIGVEVHTPGVGRVLSQALDCSIENLRVFKEDVNDVLNLCIPDASLDKVQIFFPDPWPKKRHHKRRLISASFVELLAKKIRPQGQLHLATDWVPYAEHMEEVLSESTIFENKELASLIIPRFSTRFERRGLRLGHEVRDLLYTKKDSG